MYLIRALTLVLIAIIALPTFAQKIEKPATREGQHNVVINHEEQYSVVINHEEQYSIWPKGKAIPSGWKPVGFAGNKDESLRHIEEVWTDMRPVSSRRAIALKIYQNNRREK